MTMARAARAGRPGAFASPLRVRLTGLLCGLAVGSVPVLAGGQPAATPRSPAATAAPAAAVSEVARTADSIAVAPLRRGDAILVSFSTARAVTPAVEEAIASGLPTTFTYDVELRRPSTFWFDKLMASARIAVTVRFDPLTRRYHVTLLQDGRVAEDRTTDRVDDVRRWVSVFRDLPLFTTRELQERTAYDVRVRGRTSPRHTWSFWPWARSSAHGSAGFTFAP